MPDRFPPRFTRTVDLYGPDAFARIRDRGALVVGLGGVGAHCAVALARSGVGRLKLIDFDRVTVSSLNRHPVAGSNDVGRLKTEVLASFFAATCPDTAVEAVAARVEPGNLDEMVPPAERELFPVMVDCIDAVPAKVALLAHGVSHGWRTAASLGAAGKRDGGLVRTGTLAETRVCPLARVVRRGVRALATDPARIRAVWSEEVPLPPVEAPGEPRRQPSNMMLPGMFGFALAAEAVALLAAD